MNLNIWTSLKKKPNMYNIQCTYITKAIYIHKSTPKESK